MENFDIERVWAGWQIVRLIGEGSFGKVYEIVRNNFGIEEHCALKVVTIPSSKAEVQSLRNDGMDESSTVEYYREIVEDFVQEIALMSKLKGNSNIVSYEDYAVIEHKDSIGWDIVIRMELLTDLPSYIRNHTLSFNDIIKLAIDLCNSLEICCEHRIIHRDIKPDNIFVSKNGDFKLGDFGVARTIEKTVSGLSKKGTYTYMAPEVYKGEQYGTNVDMYSLGIVMYKLLNNNREPFLPPYPAPIKYSDKNESLVRRLSGENIFVPDGTNTSPEYQQLWQIVLKACSFKPEDRYQTPTQMKEDLKNIRVDNDSEYSADTEDVLTPINTNDTSLYAEVDVTEIEVDKTISVFGDSASDFNEIIKSTDKSIYLSFDNNNLKKEDALKTKQNTNKYDDKITAFIIIGWFGFISSLVFMFVVFPYTVVQTIAILVAMILITVRKQVKVAAVVMLIASVLSFSLLNIVASIIALNIKSKNNKVINSNSGIGNSNNVCIKCGSLINEGSTVCEKCGQPHNDTQDPDKTMSVVNYFSR